MSARTIRATKQYRCHKVLLDLIEETEFTNRSPDKDLALRGFYLCLGRINLLGDEEPVNALLDLLDKIYVTNPYGYDGWSLEVVADAIEHAIIKCEEDELCRIRKK